MKVLITGAAGFIGRNILKALKLRPDDLMLLGKETQDLSLLKEYSQNVIIGDLKDLGRFKKEIIRFGPQACLHLAWQGIPDYSFETSKMNLDNSLALINLLAQETKCSKVIISGSCMEYGKTKGICRETEAANSNSFFSWAKNTLYSYADFVCKNKKINLIWFRLFYVYGIGQRSDALIPSVVNNFKARLDPGINYPQNANDFVNCVDVAEAFCLALEKKLPSGIYNLGSGTPTKAISICRVIEKELTGKTNISARILKSAKSAQGYNFWADVKKAEKLLGWRPGVTISTGIQEYINSLES